MTIRSIVTALTFCSLAFTFLALQQTAAQAADCPTGQTDQLEHYKGICMDPAKIDPQTGRLKEASKCPPGETDTLKHYKGTCMDPKKIDPQTGRLKEASKCPPGETDTLKHYKGTCMDPRKIDPQTGRLKKASKCPDGQTDKLKKYKGVCMPIEAGKIDDTDNAQPAKPKKKMGKKTHPNL
jgi:hypothetical protein